jgi:hypothetical protein
MVDLSGRIQEIKKLVDAGRYFTINRARQYGKTTTLKALQGGLQDTYEIVSISFEALTNANIATEQSFVKAFCRLSERIQSCTIVFRKRSGLRWMIIRIEKKTRQKWNLIMVTVHHPVTQEAGSLGNVCVEVIPCFVQQPEKRSKTSLSG